MAGMAVAPGGAGEAADAAASFTRVDGVDDLYYVEDAEVNLKRLIQTPLPAVPLDYAVTSHWLAIDGVQPTLPQNPLTEEDGATGPGAAGGAAKKAGGPLPGSVAAMAKNPVIVPLLTHKLGKEMQLFYEHVVGALASKNAPQQDACILAISEEPGLSQVVPYFSLYIKKTVPDSLRNLPALFACMRLTQALLTNPHHNVEFYLHQMLPSILTCLVGKRLCTSPRHNHWGLRDFTAELLAEIVGKFGHVVEYNLQPRFTKTYTDALFNKKRSLTTHYGAILGIGALGASVVEKLLLPNIKEYSQYVLQILDQTATKPGSMRRLEAAKVYGALAWAVSVSELKKDHPTLAADVLSSLDVRAEAIEKHLPEFASRREALSGAYKAQFYPQSVVNDAANIAALMLR